MFGYDPKPWRHTECLSTFRHLASSKFADVHFAFFVDGLDEFNGDHDTLITALISIYKTMGKSSHIKLCLASRRAARQGGCTWTGPHIDTRYGQQPRPALRQPRQAGRGGEDVHSGAATL